MTADTKQMTTHTNGPTDGQASEPPRDTELANTLEALLLASDAPLNLDKLIACFAFPQPERADVRAALQAIDARHEGSAIALVESAGGWRLQTRAEYAPAIARLWQEKPPKYSRALLETLSIIVYRQPITRGEIEEIRGVSLSANIVRTLLERGWVREVGHREVPGRPALLGTARQFLDDFGLKSLEQLPSLPDLQDIAALDKALAELGQLDAQDDTEAGADTPADAPAPSDTPDDASDSADSDDDAQPRQTAEPGPNDTDPDDAGAAPKPSQERLPT